jgi:uncharacterized protein
LIIDAHANPPTKEFLIDPYGDLIEYSSKFFKISIKPFPIEKALADYAEAGVDAFILHGVNAESLGRGRSPSNQSLASIAGQAKQRWLCALDLSSPSNAAAELDRSVKMAGCLGLKISPMIQGVSPNDRILHPIFETCVKLKLPAFFDWGFSAIGVGAPGGGGVRLSLNNPMLLDDLAASFPDLTIVGCHVASPWVDEMLAVLSHKANVYCVLSGWYPRMFSNDLLFHMSKRIPDKFMFGTEYPVISPSRWLSDFRALEISEESKKMILGENAARVLGISNQTK